MKQVIILITLFFAISCKTEVKEVVDESIVVVDTIPENSDTVISDTVLVSDYDMSKVDKKHVKEFKENLVKIEKEFGEQWDFCLCVVKGDSLNKAFSNPNLPDDEFNRLADRLDEVDNKCKAFRIQNPNITPEERAIHEKKVRNCLKEAGLK